MKYTLIIFTLLLSNYIISQDTLVVMQYNLLYFGVNFGECNPNTNNSVNDKILDLQHITSYVKPDIFTVNELSQSSFYHELILDNVFNINGVDYFMMGDPPNISGSSIINQVFYNSEKLTLMSEISIAAGVRDIDFFRFMYNDDSNNEDTIYLTCVVAHLKAGSGSDDEQQRAQEALSVMSYLNDVNASGNYLFMGDLNLYSHNEQAFQYLVNHYNESIRFYDPINKMGSWNNNDYFSQYHTQSTHTDSDCFTSGGMDDRFDFILISDEVKDGTNGIQFIDGSYWAVGQDGEHFNTSILDYPENYTVPQNVLAALYDMSDHLPVKLELLVDKSLGINPVDLLNGGIKVIFIPGTGELRYIIPEAINPVKAEILDMNGRIVHSECGSSFNDNIGTITTISFTNGIYLLLLYDKTGKIFTVKFPVSVN